MQTESISASGTATLFCTGRDIEYRELELAQNKQTHCWEVQFDSLENPDALLDDMVSVFAEFIKAEKEFRGSPSELAEKVFTCTGRQFAASALSKKLLQSKCELERVGIVYTSKSSNSKRIVTAIFSDGSVGSDGKSGIPPYPKTAVLP